MNIYNDFKNQIFEIFLKVTKDNNKIMADIDATDIYSLWKIYKKDNYLIIDR